MSYIGFFLFILGMLLVSGAQAGGYNVSGKILKPDGTPFSGLAINFVIEMTNTSGTCAIYKEQHSVDMLESKAGAFHIVFGEGTRIFPSSGALTADSSVFNNISYTCVDGSTYTPAPQDERAIKITFFDGQAWQVFSQQALKSVPSATLAKYATSADSAQTAETVATFQAANLLRSSSSTLPDLDATQAANLQTIIARYTDIKNIIDGTSSLYLKVEADPFVKTFAKNNLPACGAGQVLTTTDGINLSCMTPPAGGGGTLPTGTDGEFMRHDGAGWLAATIMISDVQNLTSQLSFLQTNKQEKSGFPACGAYQQLVFSTPADTWSCVSISLAGDVVGTAGASTVAKVQGVPVSNTAPANGQVLTYNGSQWMPSTPPGSGTVTTITTGTGLTGGPITVSGTIALSTTTVTANSYGTSTAVPNFTVDAYGRLTAASNTAILFPVTMVAGKTGNIALTYSDIVNQASVYLGYAPGGTQCAAGQTLTWNNSRWECGSAGGDLGGSYSALTVTAIRNKPVSSTPPVAGDVLVFKSGSWTPAQLGCPSGWTIVDRGEPFCIKYLGTSLTYTSATNQCGTLRANICNIQQLMHANADSKLFSGNTNILLDQLHSNTIPLFFTPSSTPINISPGATLSDTGNAHCCRRQEY